MKNSSSLSLDKLGICTSMLCMTHCILVPVVLAFGFGSLNAFITQEWVEWLFISASLILGITSFLRGFQLHRRYFIPFIFIVGFLLLVNADSFADLWISISLSIAGAMMIAFAHLQNIKWKRLTGAASDM